MATNPWATGQFVDPIMEEFFASGKGNTAFGIPFIRPTTPTVRASEADALAAARAGWSRLNANQMGAGLGWTAKELEDLMQKGNNLSGIASFTPAGSVGGPGQAMSGTNYGAPSTAPLGSNNPTLPPDPRSTAPGLNQFGQPNTTSATPPGAFNSMQDMWNAGQNLNNQPATPNMGPKNQQSAGYDASLGNKASSGFTSPGGATPRDYSPMKPGESMQAFYSRLGVQNGVLPSSPTAAANGAVNPVGSATGGAQPFSGLSVPFGQATGGGMPTMPNVSPEDQEALQKAETAYQELLKLSPENLSTQADLDRIQDSFNKGFQNIQDQSIALEFITGQQQSLENRALNLAEPLEKKLARLQAERVAALDASKFALSRQDEKLAQQKKDTANAQELAFRRQQEAERIREFNVSEARLGSKETSLNTQIVNVGGRQLLINQDTGATIKDLGASTIGTSAGGIISLSEAKSLGLPISVVGMSQADILASIQSSTVPSWFKKYAEDQTQSSMTPQTLQSAWDAFRQQVGSKSPTTKTTNSTSKLDLLESQL